LKQAGIDDLEILCQPCVTKETLETLFGTNAMEVIRAYFTEKMPSIFRFKSPMPTTKEITSLLRGGYPDNQLDMIRRGLLKLFDDVVLIPENPDDSIHFHPRILMDRTSSFKLLDERTREALCYIYRDYFFSRQEDLWKAGGYEKLSAIASAAPMLICGEDLGMVPHCVPGVLARLKILSLRIQRMPVHFGEIFGDPACYPYLSIASPGSHDTSTLRGWWEETDRAVIQFYYQNILGHRGITPKTCETEICRQIINLHRQSKSMWAIFPMQDILAMSAELRRQDPHAERINDPATPRHNWNYRLHLTLENLIEQEAFNTEMGQMIIAAGR
ncbi:MAG: 4-alpha-glucanotransferase, partial [Syntrophales bacterium]|nr:4-alpha-glucanotransferase [Syntrophales bacterium]